MLKSLRGHIELQATNWWVRKRMQQFVAALMCAHATYYIDIYYIHM